MRLYFLYIPPLLALSLFSVMISRLSCRCECVERPLSESIDNQVFSIVQYPSLIFNLNLILSFSLEYDDRSQGLFYQPKIKKKERSILQNMKTKKNFRRGRKRENLKRKRGRNKGYKAHYPLS